MVVLTCGHVELEWPAVRALCSLVDSAYCDTCREWIPIVRGATVYEEIAGAAQAAPAVPVPGSLFDSPPF